MRNETRIRRTVAGIQGERAVNEWVKQRVVSAVDRGIPKNVECRGRILHCRNLRQFPVSYNDETHHCEGKKMNQNRPLWRLRAIQPRHLCFVPCAQRLAHLLRCLNS